MPVLVGAGVGRFLLRELAKNLALPYLDFSDLLPCALPASELAIADCAPALAVAALLINPKNAIEIAA
jgi:hypothetical protein